MINIEMIELIIKEMIFIDRRKGIKKIDRRTGIKKTMMYIKKTTQIEGIIINNISINETNYFFIRHL